MTRIAVVLVLLAAVVALDTASVAPAGSAATQVLDRTFSCAVVTRGGTRELEARAHTGTRDGGRWFKLPYAGLRAGVFSGPTGNLLAWVTAGKPDAATTIDQEFETLDARAVGTIGIRAKACSAAKGSVPLSRRGLSGGTAAAIGDELECVTPRRVLVRIRARLSGKASLGGRGDFRSLHAPVREAKLAVRTLTGKQLAYAEVSESGSARLFTAKGCTLQ